MIQRLHGQIVAFQGQGTLILDVNGVGYGVTCPAEHLQDLSIGQDLTLWIETIVRQDAIQLFGFRDFLEQRCFRLLVTVPGVGARVALSILSRLSPRDMMEDLGHQRKERFTPIEGIGPRLAGRLITELKEKASKMLLELGGAVGTTSSSDRGTMAPSSIVAQALQALIRLGYRQDEAARALEQIPTPLRETGQIADLIRETLSVLGKSR